MAHLQLGEREGKKKKRGEREKHRSGTEAGKVRERTPAGAQRGREAVTSCSPGCSAKARPRQPPAPGSKIWLMSASAPRGCSSPRRCCKASPGHMDPGMWAQGSTSFSLGKCSKGRAKPQLSSCFPHLSLMEIPPRSHVFPNSSYKERSYTFGVLRDGLPIQTHQIHLE